MNEKIAEIRQKLELLKQKDQEFKVFGAKKHKYLLNPCLSEEKISHIEQKYKIDLPPDYRRFMLDIGNGGAGPCYGLFSLEEAIDCLQRSWRATINIYYTNPKNNNLLIRDFIRTRLENREFDFDFLSQSFPLTFVQALWAIEQRIKAPDEDYFIKVEQEILSGYLILSERGCGWQNVLIITGEQKGLVWLEGGLEWLPSYDKNYLHNNFLEWYQHWLDEALYYC